ncbi:MAG: hypothetical protein JWR69_1528 [Pedosphaera sp.]|nr:hypothetical protein [Pedosphaera sp.]
MQSKLDIIGWLKVLAIAFLLILLGMFCAAFITGCAAPASVTPSRPAAPVQFLGRAEAALAAAPMPTVSTWVAWDLLADTNITGYALSYGRTHDGLTNKLVIGRTNLCLLSNLQPATLYYLAVAGTALGIEQDRSPAIMFLPPGVLMLTVTNQNAVLRFLPVSNLVINACSDLKHWTNYYFFPDPQHVAEWSDPLTTRRFYRLTKQLTNL